MGISRNIKLLAVGILPCVIVSAAAFFVVPWFNSIYAAAGMVGVWRPLITRILIATYPWWGVTVLATLVFWLRWPVAANRGRVAAMFGSVCSVALLVFGFIGCYAPLFALAGSR
jgi:hypothetical protein